jgi:Domain of unknown function (DUF4352)
MRHGGGDSGHRCRHYFGRRWQTGLALSTSRSWIDPVTARSKLSCRHAGDLHCIRGHGVDRSSRVRRSAVELPSTTAAASPFDPTSLLLPPVPEMATIGQQVRDGNFAFTVTKVDPPRKAIGTATAQGNYVTVYMTVINIGNEPHVFREFNQLLQDTAGRKYGNDIPATGKLDLEQDGDVDFKAWINPGSSDKFAVVFDLPVGAPSAAVELHELPGYGGALARL